MNTKELLNEKDYTKEPIVLSVKKLQIAFTTDHGLVKAVRGVSFDLHKGETLCIVGESGSGKSVTNKAIMGISANNAIIEGGQILYEGEDLTRISEEDFHRIRGHKIGMIFQDPLSALNPIVRVGKQITEATMINKNILKKRYNDLISDELIAYRNAKADKDYEVSRDNNEIKNITKLYKNHLNDVKKNIKVANDELANKQKVCDMIENFETEQKNRLVCYQNSIEKYQKLKDETSKKTDEISKIKTEIYTLKVSKFENRIVRVKNQLDNYKESEALDIRVNNFIAYYKETKKLVNSEYNAVKGLLKKALVLRKKEAKVDNKQYAEDLEKKYKEELSSLEQQLETVNAKIEEYQPKLSKEAQEKYDIILSYSRKKTLKERIFKKNNDINTSISNTVKKAEKVSLTDDATFDGYLAEQKSLKSKINKCKENYINKTKITKAEAKKMALRVMKEVGIPLPERRYKQYPFEFSGGMRQRIVIAIALTADPEILICDEPTTALDVTIQAQILELINKLKRERGLSCIFITHDLGVVANMADRVAVMYAGKVVEYGLANEIFFSPKHPYTWALLSSIPDVDSKERLEAIPGTPPDMIYPPKGDAFALRSKYAMAIDFKYEPPYFKVSDTHYAATWLLYPGAPKVEMPKIVSTRIKNALKSEEERIKKEGKEAK